MAAAIRKFTGNSKDSQKKNPLCKRADFFFYVDVMLSFEIFKFIYDFLRNSGVAETSIVEEILHRHFSGKV